jgi:hypothetical protein
MDRRCFVRLARLALVLPIAAAALSAAGCSSALFTVMYLFKGTNVPAECDQLKEKRVVVVCRPVVSLQYRNAHVEHDIAREVGELLRKNVPKIKVVDHRKVAEWMDANYVDDYVEVGKALHADMVVGIDLEQFTLLQGQTLYQGRATVGVKVHDCKTGKPVFQKRPPQTVYPPNRVVQTSEKQESDFRREFVQVLADQIARHFYEHDAYADVALDAKSMD